MRSTTLLTMFSLCPVLGWILNLYWHSFICECMLHPLLFLIILQLICLPVKLHVLPWVVASAHAIPSLFLSLPLYDILVALSPHSLNFQRCFHHEWIYFKLGAFISLYFVNNLSLAFVTCRCATFYYFLWCSHCDVISIHLDILVYEKIYVSIGRQAHKHLLGC